MRVMLIHQHDPTSHHVGGIGTFLNTFIKYAPADFDVSVVGVAVDPKTYPIGRWHRLHSGEKPFDFLPIVAADPCCRGRVPLSLRFTGALIRYRRRLDFHDAILDLHRVEPSLALRDLANPKVLFLHSHPKDLSNPHTEVVWGKAPRLYFWLERHLIQGMARIFIVREDAVGFYKARYPKLAERFTFLPTWVDEEVFVSLPDAERERQKRELAQAHGLRLTDRLVLFVGRFEGQKDPLLLLRAFRHLNGLQSQTRLVMIGDGSLEPAIRSFIEANRLTHGVRLLGPQPQVEIARWMNIADCLCLSSAFEGMPRVVVEALQCGLPVVSTDVGEARRLIGNSVAGRLVRERTPQVLGAAMAGLLSQPPERKACQQQAAPFSARKVLEQVYSAYRDLNDTFR